MLVWDATCPDTLAPSYSDLASREVGAVAEEAERKKKAKYAHLEANHCFISVAIETLGEFGPEAHCFISLRDLGRRIADTTLDLLSAHHLRQTIAVAVQRGNAAAILGTSYSSNFAPDPFSPAE